MAEFKLKRLKYNWKGSWTASTEYYNDDVVRLGAYIYVCVAPHAANADFYQDLNFLNNEIPPSVEPRWVVMVESVSWQGPWTENTYYTRGALVKQGAVVYLCVEEHTSAATESDFVGNYVDDSYWIIYSQSEQWTRDWAASKIYNLGDIVVNSGTVYRCLLAHVSSSDALIGLKGDLAKWEIVYYNLNWQGDWTVDQIYYEYDVVKYGGIVYRCIEQHMSAATTALGLEYNQDKWVIQHDGVEYMGEWSQAQQYRTNDVVKYGSYLYKATGSNLVNSGQYFDPADWSIYCPGTEYEVEWINSLVYQPGDIVKYGGYLFTAVSTHINQAPTDANNSYWNLLFVNTRIRGEWTGSTSYLIGDVVRRQGQLFTAKRDVAITDTDFIDDGSSINTDDWELTISGSKWQGSWVEFRTYVIGDLVLYRSGAYRCIGKHLSYDDNSPSGNYAAGYWEKYTYSDVNNVLTYVGDIKSFGLKQDGSTIGDKSVAVGNEGTVLQSSSGEVDYKAFNSTAKVYFVSLDGEDSRFTGTSQNAPYRTVRYALENITGPATVFVKNGKYNEILPLRVPAFVAVVGDELRGTVIQANNTDLPVGDTAALLSVIDYLNYIIEFIIQAQPIGTDIVSSPAYGSTLYGTEPQSISGAAGTSTQVTAARALLAQIRGRLATGTASVLTGTNTASVNANVLAAVTQLTNNIEFFENEFPQYINFLLSSYSQPARFVPDIIRIVTAVAYDLRYPGNYQSTLVGNYFYHLKLGSENKLSNMFLMNDGTGLRNCTLMGLEGQLGALNTNLTRRPTAGAYASLDPGYGPTDTTAWVGSKSPYIQNVTTFGTACVGLKIDGDLHDGGNQTIVSNDFTQILSDGIGLWINGTGKTEAVSVFTYYNHIGYLSTNGGKIRATNGNNSYGTFGAIAEGFDADEIPITATVLNRYYDATVATAFTASGEVRKLFYSHAGNEYTTAALTIAGAGLNGVATIDEFRDGAVYEVRITDPGDSSGSGGGGYTTARNTAQSGTAETIVIAGSDEGEASAYRSLRLIIDTGTGAGQYGYIAEFDEVSKTAWIASEFKPQQPVIATTSSGNRVTVGTTEYLNVDDPIIFSGTFAGNLQQYQLYYVRTIVNATQITVSLAPAGVTVLLINGVGAMIMHHLGWNNFRPGTVTEPVLDTTTAYAIEARITFSSPGYSAVPVVLPSAQDWVSITYGDGLWVAVSNGTSPSGSNAAGYSSDGTTWSSTVLPGTNPWIKVAYGNGIFVTVASNGAMASSNDGIVWNSITATVNPYNSVVYGGGTWVAISAGVNIVTSTDAITWTPSVLPEGADWIDIAYGKGKFVAVSQSDSSIAQTAYSTNGTVWTLGSFVGGSKSIAYGNDRFVAIEGGYALANSAFVSFDGITWTAAALDQQNWQSIKYFQGTFAAVAESYDKIALSIDGANWRYQTLSGVLSWRDIAGGGIGKFVAVTGLSNSTVGNLISTGTTPQARVTVGSGRIGAITIWEPGSGYTSAPVMVITDPNNSSEATVEVRIGNGVLGPASFNTPGIGYSTTTTTVTVTGDGYKDQFQLGRFLVVENLTRIPSPGDNLNISSIDDYTYKVLNTTVLGGTVGDYTAQITIAKILNRNESPAQGETLTIRQLYSQVRLTGHDFLDIGLGNFIQTNYPDTLFPNGTVTAPQDEIKEADGGRVFYTSTDQDGNFRVGELFAVEQSTGTVTISADFFVLEGLEELTIGGVSVGGSGVVIREFSTDTLFTADSNNIVPTQRAIKAYLSKRVSGGGSEAFTASLVAGVVSVGPSAIGTTTSVEINIPVKVNFKQPFEGDLFTNTYFLAGRGAL